MVFTCACVETTWRKNGGGGGGVSVCVKWIIIFYFNDGGDRSEQSHERKGMGGGGERELCIPRTSLHYILYSSSYNTFDAVTHQSWPRQRFARHDSRRPLVRQSPIRYS